MIQKTICNNTYTGKTGATNYESFLLKNDPNNEPFMKMFSNVLI